MTRWARDPRALWRRSGSRVVLGPPGQDDSVLLDGTGAITWLLLAEPIEHAELVALLTETYDADEATVDAEVAAFLEQLRDLDAVVAS